MTNSKFILVKHEAKKRGLHYDLRFRMPNSANWVSFSLNDLPPTEPGKRVYIARTNDHSEKEALFIGVIPEGEYGAGKITKIDGGNCEIEKFTNAHMIVIFKGSKLKGKYQFVNTGVFDKKRNYSKKTYAFFKSKDQVLENLNMKEKNKLLENYLEFLRE